MSVGRDVEAETGCFCATSLLSGRIGAIFKVWAIKDDVVCPIVMESILN